MIFNILNQSRRIFAHAEEVCFFFHRLDIRTADRALSICRQLALCIECLALLTVHSLVLAFVDITLVIQLLENMLHRPLMILIRRADELVIREIHDIELLTDLCRYFIHELFRGYACLLCLLFYFLTMLICSGLETDIIADLPLVAGNGICQYDFVDISDMRFAGSIGNRSSNVIRSLILHGFHLPGISKRKTPCERTPCTRYHLCLA